MSCPYDITCEQPRLFVTKSCRHLSQVLEEFATSMYARIAKLNGHLDEASINRLCSEAALHPDEWLLRVELLNALDDIHATSRLKLVDELREIQSRLPESAGLIAMALGVLSV